MRTTVPLRLRLNGVSDPRTALRLRVLITNAVLILGGAAYLALSPQTVGWPPTADEGGELAAWALTILLIDYVVLRFIFRRQRRPASHPGHALELTIRELEVVRLIAHGYTAKEIAETLCISPKTVDAHRAHILRKLGVHDRVAVARYAIKRGLVEP
jgi:DNA-binding CsgD family transcriptional regulator